MRLTITLEKEKGTRKEIEAFDIQGPKHFRSILKKAFEVAEDELIKFIHEKT